MSSNYDYTNIAPPRIRESAGYTVNLGNFETLRLDTEVEDVKRPKETMEEASERLFNFAVKQVEGRVARARETLLRGD